MVFDLNDFNEVQNTRKTSYGHIKFKKMITYSSQKSYFTMIISLCELERLKNI